MMFGGFGREVWPVASAAEDRIVQEALRDQLAMAALTALGQFFARDWHNPNEYQVKRMAEGAYMIADAMLAARGGK